MSTARKWEFAEGWLRCAKGGSYSDDSTLRAYGASIAAAHNAQVREAVDEATRELQEQLTKTRGDALSASAEVMRLRVEVERLKGELAREKDAEQKAALLFTDAQAENDRLKARVKELKAQVERERVRLAGCSVAALGYSRGDVKPGDYGHSASYDDVVRLRERCEAAEAQLKTQAVQVEPAKEAAPVEKAEPETFDGAEALRLHRDGVAVEFQHLTDGWVHFDAHKWKASRLLNTATVFRRAPALHVHEWGSWHDCATDHPKRACSCGATQVAKWETVK